MKLEKSFAVTLRTDQNLRGVFANKADPARALQDTYNDRTNFVLQAATRQWHIWLRLV